VAAVRLTDADVNLAHQEGVLDRPYIQGTPSSIAASGNTPPNENGLLRSTSIIRPLEEAEQAIE